MKIDYGRKLYSLAEVYKILVQGMRTVKYMRKAKKNNDLQIDFIERIMLAVTEVNGCAICSYAHAKIALEAGMSNEEIQNMLTGSVGAIPKEELPAVLFAQHYAESRAMPSAESWNRIAEVYGADKAYEILAAIRMIMIGNAYGIPWSSFFNRLKAKPDKRSSLLYEISIMTAGTLFIFFAHVHAWIANLLKAPLIETEKRASA
jgi:AhpD family alkylhydroperoxidase